MKVPNNPAAAALAEKQNPQPRTSLAAAALAAVQKSEPEALAPDPVKPAVEVAPPVTEPAKDPVTEPAKPPGSPEVNLDDPKESDEAIAKELETSTKTMSPDHKRVFTHVRYENRDLKRKIKASEAKIAELEAKATAAPTTSPEIEAEVQKHKAEVDRLNQRVQEYESELMVARVESTPDFKSKVTAPRKEIIDAASVIGEKYKVEPEAFAALFRKAPGAFEKVTADMVESDRFELYGLVSRFDGVAKVEAELRKNSAELVERTVKERQAQSETATAEQRKAWQTAAPDSWKSLQEEFPVLQEIDGDPEWEKELTQIRDFASPDRYPKLAVKDQAQVLHRAAAFPVLIVELEALRNELEEKTQELEKIHKSTPAIGADSSAPPATSSSRMSLGAAVAARMKTAA